MHRIEIKAPLDSGGAYHFTWYMQTVPRKGDILLLSAPKGRLRLPVQSVEVEVYLHCTDGNTGRMMSCGEHYVVTLDLTEAAAEKLSDLHEMKIRWSLEASDGGEGDNNGQGA